MNLVRILIKHLSNSLLRVPIFICLVLQSQHVFSQGNTVISYEQEDGLCGLNQITCFIDRSGKLWTGSYSAAGVNCFDGSKWNCLGYSKGILPFGVSEIFEDGFNNIWFYQGDHGLSMINNKGIFSYKFNSDELPGNYDYFQKQGILHLINRENYSNYVYDQSLGKFIYSKTNTSLCSVLKKKNLKWNNSGSFRSDGVLFFSSLKAEKGGRLKEFYTYKNGELSRIPAHTHPDEIQSNDNYIYKENFFSIEENRIIINRQDNSELVLKTDFFDLNGRNILLKLKGIRAYNFNVEKNELIVIYELLESRRYLLVEYNMQSGQQKRSLIYHSDYSPHDVCKDHANTYWIATEANMQRVLTYQLHLASSNENYPSQTWSIIQSKDGNMWMSSYGMGLARFDGYKIYNQPDYFPPNARFDDGAILDEGKMLFNREGIRINGIGDNLSAGLFVFDGVRPPQLKLKGTLGFYLGRNNNNELIRGTLGNGLWILPKNAKMDDERNWVKIDSSKGMYLNNVLTAIQDKYGRYWMGKPTLGFSIFDSISGKCKNFLKSKDPKTFGIMSMDEDAQGNLWLGTDDGLYFLKNTKDLFDKNNILKSAVKISPDVLGNSIINICKVYNKNTLVIGNLLGYFMLDIDHYYKYAGKVRFIAINKLDYKNYLGGQTNQNGIAFDKDGSIWVVTSKGIYRHDPDIYIQDTIPTFLILDSMIIGKRTIKFEKENECINLEHTERSFTIYFHHTFSPYLYKNVKYRYRLDSSLTWSALSDRDSINYQNLSPGKYNLQIQAVKNGIGSPVKNISFIIDQVIWLKWWFWLVIASIVSSGLIFLYAKQRRIHSQKLTLSQKETEVEIMSKEKDRLQVQAIVNQLNPHFINNALQWLQVRVDDDVEAVKVIGKLSENISTVFKNSRKQINYHSLHAEIQLTNNYLYIQKCRFGDKLNIEIPALEALGELGAYNVPIMMVQIHAENAIEHGIRNNDNGGGTVNITVVDNGDTFIMNITDDGVGRERSKHIGSRGTQNGTKMLSEIEKIFNKQNKLKLSQYYIDGIYTNSEGASYGTQVIITIPKQYNYIL